MNEPIPTLIESSIGISRELLRCSCEPSAPAFYRNDGLSRRETKTDARKQDAQQTKCWAHRLGVSREDLGKVVEKVGNSAAEVRKELEK